VSLDASHQPQFSTFENIGEINCTARKVALRKRMAKSRKRHVQQPLFKPRGGKRRGAGRKSKGPRAGSPHTKRPVLKASQPVHVVLRIVDEVRSRDGHGMRKRDMYKAMREATITVARHAIDEKRRTLEDQRRALEAMARELGVTSEGSARSRRRNLVEPQLRFDIDAKRESDEELLRELDARRRDLAASEAELDAAGRGVFRIIHLSIQRSHVHLIVEASNRAALSRGMQSFQISAAKHINAALRDEEGRRRRGRVFADRFHQEIIRTPRQARNTLAYVLNNWRKHGDDRARYARTWNVDPFSTGVLFDGWKELDDAELTWRWRETYDPLVVYLPKTWLLKEGWRRGGPLIRFGEIPSAPHIEG
jgi:hypothetical protein